MQNQSILRFTLLGEFGISLNGEPLRVVLRPRQQALLAYLLLHRGTLQLRQKIAFDFWPDSSETQAFTNLRKLFFQLRRSLPQGEMLLFADQLHIGWQSYAAFELDVSALEATLDALAQGNAGIVAGVDAIINLYPGELLPGCYDDWIFPRRTRLHADVMNALVGGLEKLDRGDGKEAEINLAAGLRAARHLIRLDPLYEAGYRYAMHYAWRLGDRGLAIRYYQDCAELMRRELEVEPGPETNRLHAEILGECVLAPTPAVTAQPQQQSTQRQLSPLIGREAAWHELLAVWELINDGAEAQARESARHGHGCFAHMIVLRGETGIGKTRLAREFVAWAARQGALTAMSRCLAAHQKLAYAPLTALLRTPTIFSGLGLMRDIWIAELGRLLPELLETRADLSGLPSLQEATARLRFYEALTRAVLSAGQPLVLFMDNLQWCDADTLEWLAYLFQSAPRLPVLVVGTVRDDIQAGELVWQSLRGDLVQMEQLTEITLAPLSEDETVPEAGHMGRQKMPPAFGVYTHAGWAFGSFSHYIAACG